MADADEHDAGEGGENFAEDMRDVALALASPDLDDDETERNVSEAMWLIKNDEARAALADGLGIEAVDACTTDDGYERTLNLLLNALVLEVEAVADAFAEEAEQNADDPPTGTAQPTSTSNGICRAVCRLVVRSALGSPDGSSPPTEMDMRQEAMDILSETLGGEHDLGSVVVESLLSVARAPLDDSSNRGEYGPALVLAHHTRDAAPPLEDDSAKKWNSSAEDAATAFRRDLMDLLGRRVFVLGGNALPATSAEVSLLCSPLISLLTKEEFDGSILRPLKFKLMSAPDTAMDAVSAFVDALTDAGNGNFVEPHLGVGTDLVGTAVKVLIKHGGDVSKASAAAGACASLARASPVKGADAVVDGLSGALRENEDASAKVGLCLGLEAVARVMLREREEGRGERSWVQLADEAALTALEGHGGTEGREAAMPWYDIAGKRPPSPDAAAAAAAPAAAGVAAAAPAAAAAAAAGAGVASAAAARRSRGPNSASSTAAADAAAKNRARGGPNATPARRPGAQAASNLDDRIAAKTRSGSRERDMPAGAGAAGAAGNVASNDRDAADAAAKARARGGGGPGGPQRGSRRPGAQSTQDLDARIQQKAGQRGGGPAPNQRGGPRGSQGGPGGQRGSQQATREQLDQLDARIRNKSRAGPGGAGGGPGGPSPLGPEDDDWDRIRGKSAGAGSGHNRGPPSFVDEGDRDQKIVVTSGAGTSYGVGPGPGGSIPIKGGDDDEYGRGRPVDDYDDKPPDGGMPRGGGGDDGGYNDGGGGGYSDVPGDLAYGTAGGGFVDDDNLPEGADGLAVAVAVSPDEDEAFIPAAIEYDPDSKPPLYKNRRFRIYSIAAVVLLVLVVVAVVVAVVFQTKEKESVTTLVAATAAPTPPPTPMPTSERWTMGVREQIEELVGMDKVGPGAPADTPYVKARDWLLEEDPMQLQKDSPFIVQRYLLALLYFSADRDGEWRHCAPSDDEDDQECKAVVYDQEGMPYNDTFARMLSGASECDWYGVRCPGGDNFVREIEMIENNMTGTLPSELAKMPVLQRLSFIMNELEGTLHAEFGDMKHLIDIEFHYNKFSGTIPDSFYNADNLIRLNLGGNMLDGTISPKIKNLRSLVGLFTFDNAFTGEIPKEIGELDYLSYTRFSYNEHNGTFPTEIGQLTNLIELYSQWNKFTGTLPPTIGELTYLEDFFVNNNEFRGTLPIKFYSMESLTYFYCFDNSFSGTISPLIKRLTNLERFIIRRNYFTGTIPAELAELRNISMVWAHYNDFTGQVTDDFCDLYDEPYQLVSFYADCGPSDNTGEPAVECVCCTDCCDTVQETCLKNE